MADPTGRAFVVRPFGSKSNARGEAAIDFDAVDSKLVAAALEQVGLNGGTTIEFIQQGNIRTDMFRQLLAADLVVADISIHNANAFYELGIRHALRARCTVLIKADKRGDEHVFDLKPERYFSYDPDDPALSVAALAATLRATLKSERPDSPVFELLPGLTSVDPGTVVVVPLVFREQVEQAAGDADALAALREAAGGEAWETEGLRLIGRMQFELGDHEGSGRTWERIRAFDMFDLEANQKLATNYQKLGALTASEQAAKRALQSHRLRDWDRAEIHALIGSNDKTRWHALLESEAESSARQREGLASPLLERSYQAYAKGFEAHRSHYYSGLNAVAMLTMQLALAELHPDLWALDFDDDEDAGRALKKRREHLAKLVAATELAIESSIRNYPDDDWARLSKADLMLLSSHRPDKVGFCYKRCASIPAFNAASLRRQLKIYRDLALFEDNVKAALESIADR